MKSERVLLLLYRAHAFAIKSSRQRVCRILIRTCPILLYAFVQLINGRALGVALATVCAYNIIITITFRI